MSNDENPIDRLPGLLADIDQALAMVGEMARYQKGLYEGYVEAGFTDKQALYLAAEHLKPSSPPLDT
jgi:hypothetical protein